MATGPNNGSMGPIALVALLVLAAAVFFFTRDPETAELVAAGDSKRDGESVVSGTAIALGVGVLAAVLGAAFTRGTRR